METDILAEGKGENVAFLRKQQSRLLWACYWVSAGQAGTPGMLAGFPLVRE